MRTLGDSFLDIAKGITQIATPVLNTGATVFTEQQKQQINMERIRQGKQPCTSQMGQPRDCPLPLFAPQMPVGMPPRGGVPGGQPMPGGGRRRKGGGGLIILGLVVVVGIIGFIVMSNKPEEASSAADSKR